MAKIEKLKETRDLETILEELRAVRDSMYEENLACPLAIEDAIKILDALRILKEV